MDLTESRRESFDVEESPSKPTFQHSFWRILLIICSLISFILVCIFNGLASRPMSTTIFHHKTESISNNNPTEITPDDWTFSIWGVIYFWQAAWLIYALSRLPRKSNENYLYIHPNTLHCSIFIFYIINMSLNIGWLFLWDRESFGSACLVLFFAFLTAILPMIQTHVLLQHNRPIYVESNQTNDIWYIRFFVHNGLAVYSVWLYLATLINLTVWLSHTDHKDHLTNVHASTIALTLILIGIVVYFICENVIFYSSMAYTYLPWFVFIFTLAGIVSKNSKRTDVSSRNRSFAVGLLIVASSLFAIRLALFVFRYRKKKIPHSSNP